MKLLMSKERQVELAVKEGEYDSVGCGVFPPHRTPRVEGPVKRLVVQIFN